MPTLVRLGRVKVRMYPDDHLPPHFHVIGPDSEALVTLDTLDVLRGLIQRRDLEAVAQWANANRAFLWQEWRRLHGSDSSG